jgi:hypothetical protein
MGARLHMSAKAGLGADPAAMVGRTVAEAAGSLQADATAGPFVHEVSRVCVDSEVVRGRGARWRLDELSDHRRLAVEGHQLEVVLEVEPGNSPVHAAGYLQAYSDPQWLSMSLGAFLRELSEAVRRLFERGVPIEVYAEWEDILRPPG